MKEKAAGKIRRDSTRSNWRWFRRSLIVASKAHLNPTLLTRILRQTRTTNPNPSSWLPHKKIAINNYPTIYHHLNKVSSQFNNKANSKVLKTNKFKKLLTKKVNLPKEVNKMYCINKIQYSATQIPSNQSTILLKIAN